MVLYVKHMYNYHYDLKKETYISHRFYVTFNYRYVSKIISVLQHSFDPSTVR